MSGSLDPPISLSDPNEVQTLPELHHPPNALITNQPILVVKADILGLDLSSERESGERDMRAEKRNIEQMKNE